MLRETEEELTNLHLLRDVVWPEIERRQAKGLLNLDYYERVQGCRTFLCVLGSCCEHPIMKARGFALCRERLGAVVFVIPRYRGADIRGSSAGAPKPGFGLSEEEDRALFGNSDIGGTLADRRGLLERLIAGREARLVAAA